MVENNNSFESKVFQMMKQQRQKPYEQQNGRGQFNYMLLLNSTGIVLTSVRQFN
jgi:hypothetical protein